LGAYTIHTEENKEGSAVFDKVSLSRMVTRELQLLGALPLFLRCDVDDFHPDDEDKECLEVEFTIKQEYH
jgi:hypothetical protein